MTYTLTLLIDEYIAYCELQKRLDVKTLKAYRIDIKQFSDYFKNIDIYSYDNLKEQVIFGKTESLP